MTIDQKIQLWNAIGTWVAGIATFLAVVVSLYLSGKSERVRLKCFVNISSLIAGDGSPAERNVVFGIVNLGNRPVTINSIGWRIGRRSSVRECVQVVGGLYSSQYPIQVAHGDTARFLVPLNESINWGPTFAERFVIDVTNKNLKSLRALIHTSVGQTFVVKPAQAILHEIQRSVA
jgi:hypothetical protein